MQRQKLFLVPGLICDATVWSYQKDHLSDIADVSILNIRDSATDIKQVAKEFLNKAPALFALAGFSMGGFISLEILRQDPARITKLALLDTSTKADTEKKTAWREKMLSYCHSGSYSHVIDEMLPILVSNDHIDTQIGASIRTMAHNVGPTVYENRQRICASRQDTTATLMHVGIPIRVIAGRQDAMANPHEQMEMANRLKNSRGSLVEDSGHTTPLEQPQAVTALMRDWITYD